MAALRNGIHEVLLPEGNVADLEEIDPDVRNAVNFTAITHMDQVLEKALLPQPEEAPGAVYPIPSAEKPAAPGSYITQ